MHKFPAMFRILLFVTISLLLLQCETVRTKAQQTMHQYTNNLVNESSPYLLQHAHNPVDWYPWGDGALEQARKENKMLIISIGYAACHWCHVMEHESFEDTAVARVMNEHFINIKVDREERPDIDDVYMTACHLASRRSCGWPLNAFALPDGRPVWAGTYFPKKEWINIMEYFIKLRQDEPEKLEEYATSLTEGIRTSEELDFSSAQAAFTNEAIFAWTDKFKSTIDPKKGGRKGAPKFPMPNNYQFLLKYAFQKNDPEAKAHAVQTLQEMYKGGIYDHLGGGFARYSVDAEWHVPHFEKMLYDNGQLVSLYAQAYQWTGDPLYQKVVEDCLTFIERELYDSDAGVFYSSLDADSEGEEGKFYVWNEAEIDSLLPEDAGRDLFKEYYDVKERGNWEHGKNVLRIQQSDEEVASKFGLSISEMHSTLDASRTILMQARDSRVRPGLDDKALTSWNALMLKGYLDAFSATANPHYLQVALRNAEFITETQMQDDGRLNRNYKDGRSSINAFLDDYALLIEALITLYQATFDEKWLNKANLLTKHAIDNFYEEASGMFNFTSNQDAPLIARKKELADNVIPGSNSAMARVLHQLGLYFYNTDYLDKSKRMLSNMVASIDRADQPSFYSNWLHLYLDMLDAPYEIAIVGNDYAAKLQEMRANYLPNAIFLGGADEGNLTLLKDKLQEGETMIYVCQNKVCKFPVDNAEAALKLMIQG